MVLCCPANSCPCHCIQFSTWDWSQRTPYVHCHSQKNPNIPKFKHLKITKFLGVIQCVFSPTQHKFLKEVLWPCLYRWWNWGMGKGLIQSPSSSNDNWGQTPVISSLSPDQCPYSCSPSFMNLRRLQLLFARNDPEVLPVSCRAQVPWSPLAWKPQDTWTLLLLAQHSWCSRRRNTSLLFCCPLFLICGSLWSRKVFTSFLVCGRKWDFKNGQNPAAKTANSTFIPASVGTTSAY